MSMVRNSDGAESLKRRAAEQAAGRIEDGMILGLGTGSTVRHLLDYIAARRAAGAWLSLLGVPTSRATELRACELGIPLTSLDRHPVLDLTIDGADEVDADLRLIKGLGGALLREKIVAAASEQLVIIVDESKVVHRLGTRSPLPIEVDPFGASSHFSFLRDLGANPQLRCSQDGTPWVTDGGHFIVDCHFAGGIAHPEELDRRLRVRPGILETGLFLGMTDAVIVAGHGEIREMVPSARG
jgi:ribose 5-phosphate isomerase A